PSSFPFRLSVRAPAPVSRFPGSAPGTCFAGSRFPWPLPFAPPTPQRNAPPCSSASLLLWRSPTSHVRASSATAPRLPDADRLGWRPDVGSPGSRTRSVRTCQGLRPRRAAQALASIAPVRVAFRVDDGVGARNKVSFAAQWLAYAFPCRRFARALADTHARLGASVGRYSFTAEDLHLLLLAGLPAHRPKTCTLPEVGRVSPTFTLGDYQRANRR